jgi:hypothetical protein
LVHCIETSLGAGGAPNGYVAIAEISGASSALCSPASGPAGFGVSPTTSELDLATAASLAVLLAIKISQLKEITLLLSLSPERLYAFESFAFNDCVYKSLMMSLLALALLKNSLAVISRNPSFSTRHTALHSAQMKLSPFLRVRLSLSGRGCSVQAISARHLGHFMELLAYFR